MLNDSALPTPTFEFLCQDIFEARMIRAIGLTAQMVDFQIVARGNSQTDQARLLRLYAPRTDDQNHDLRKFCEGASAMWREVLSVLADAEVMSPRNRD